MVDSGQGVGSASLRCEEKTRLIGFAERIAAGWAVALQVGQNAVEWVAVKGGARTPVGGSSAEAVIHQLEHDAGIAFALGAPGVMDLLFVVTHRKSGYSVNISNHTKVGDSSERHIVRPDSVGDVKQLLAAAKKYARRVPTATAVLLTGEPLFPGGQS
jgi:hypothetical protein